jgi:hypothetical protein
MSGLLVVGLPNFLPGLALNLILPILASRIAGVIDMPYYAQQLFCQVLLVSQALFQVLALSRLVAQSYRT